jgi:ATP-binding cassette subfamily B protein
MNSLIRACFIQWPLISFGLLLAVCSAWIDQFVPRMLRELPHQYEQSGASVAIVGFLALAAGIAIAAQIVKIIQRVMTDKVAAATEARLIELGISRLLKNSLGWHISNHVGHVHVRLERSANAIAGLVKIGMIDVIGPILGLIFTFVVLLETSHYAAFGMLVVAVLISTVTVWQLIDQNGVRIGINGKKEELGGQVVDAITGIEQVKIFSAHTREVQRTAAIAGELSLREYGHHVAMGKFDVLKAVIERGGIITVLGVSLLDMSGGLHAAQIGGTLMAVLLCADRFLEPLRSLHRIIDEFGEKLALAKSFLRLEESPSTKTAEADLGQKLRLVQKGSVDFHSVSFRYPDKELTLSGANASLPLGSRVAILGHTGCGKSTVGRLLCGLISPEGGAIAIDGELVQPIEKSANRRNLVGMLTQETHLIPNETVIENIRFGMSDATDDEVFQAARLAGVGKELLFDKGAPRKVTARGQGFSGGQKQRIGLARVLLQNPKIVILDEPTSAQDVQHRDRFFNQVLKTLGDRTLFVITHDRDRLEWASHIMELENAGIKVRKQTEAQIIQPEMLTPKLAAF